MNLENMTEEQLKDAVNFQAELIRQQSVELGNLTTERLSQGLVIHRKDATIKELEKALAELKQAVEGGEAE